MTLYSTGSHNCNLKTDRDVQSILLSAQLFLYVELLDLVILIAELFSLFMSCNVPTLESIGRRQKTARCRWTIMNFEILERIQTSVLTKCQHPFSKRFLARAKTNQISEKRDTLPFLTPSCKISITCINDELCLFFLPYRKRNSTREVNLEVHYLQPDPMFHFP